jgi:tetratricopeptide (TPR) repeat protein
MGIIDLRQGNIAEALERCQKSLAQYEELEDIYGQATSHNLIANAYFGRGEWSKADYHYRQSLTMFTQLGNIYNQILAENNLGGIALNQGRLEAALGYYQGAVRLLEQIGGSLWVFGALRMNIGNTLLQSNELEKASEQLRQAEEYFEKARVRDLLPELYGLKAELACRQKRLDEAEAIGQQALDLARELEMSREEGHNLRILGQVAQSRGDSDRAEALLQDSYAVLDEANDDYERAKTQLTLAHLYEEQNRREAAIKALAICEPIFGRLEATIDLQDTHAMQRRLGLTSVATPS